MNNEDLKLAESLEKGKLLIKAIKIVEKLSKIKVKDLEIIHVSLEDIFMEFYTNSERLKVKSEK